MIDPSDPLYDLGPLTIPATGFCRGGCGTQRGSVICPRSHRNTSTGAEVFDNFRRLVFYPRLTLFNGSAEWCCVRTRWLALSGGLKISVDFRATLRSSCKGNKSLTKCF